MNTAYDVKMDEKVNCKVMCTSELKEGDAEKIMQRVSEDYFVHLLADLRQGLALGRKSREKLL